MALGITGTLQITANGPVAVTVPAGTNAAVFMGGGYAGGGPTLAAVTMTGAGAWTIHQNLPPIGFSPTAVVASCKVTAVGAQTFEPTWSPPLSASGPCAVLVLLGDVPDPDDLVRGTDAEVSQAATAISLSAASEAADLVLAFDYREASAPSTPAGWTSVGTFTHNGKAGRLVTCNAPGAGATAYDAQDENYSGATLITIKGAAAGPSFAGTITADDATAAGSMESSNSSFAGAVTAGDAAAAGSFAPVSGVIVTPPLANNATLDYASVGGWTVDVKHPTTGALVVQLTGLTTNASGQLTLSSPLLVPGISYAYEPIHATHGRMLPVAVAA